MIDQRNDGEALFALGLALPILGGGNTLFTLDPQAAVYVLDLVTAVVTWRLIGSKTVPGPAFRGAPLLANAALLVLCLWWVASLMLRPSGPRASLDAQGIFCGMLLFTSLSRHTFGAAAIARLFRGLLIGTLVTVAFGQYQYWIGFSRTAPLAQAAGIWVITLVNANFYNANCYAVFLAAVTVLVADLAIVNRDPLAWTAIPIFIATMLLSESRSALALLVFAGIGLGRILGWRPLDIRNRVVTELLWVLLPAAAGVAAATVNVNELWHIGTLGRIAIWRASMAMIRDHWLFGVGLGGFADHFVQYRLNTYYTRYPHNFLLEIAAELGVVGLVSAVCFLGAALTRPVARLVATGRQPHARVALQPSLVICAAAAILLVHGLVDIDWHAPANAILLFVLLGAAQQLPLRCDDTRGS